MENDEIVVWFRPELGQQIREAILLFESIVLQSENEQEGQLVRRRIILNRPDTDDEGETNSYRERSYFLFASLMALGASASFNVAKFESPEGVR